MKQSPDSRSSRTLNDDIISCSRCPRLRKHCESVAHGKSLPRKAFLEEMRQDLYWKKPVPDFGATPSKILIVGLAPAAHGANRTGRMFTGDESGKWLYRALKKAGLAKTDGFERADDNELFDTCITAVAHCAPPDNKPSSKEVANCRDFLTRRFQIAEPKVVLALGGIAWKASLEVLIKELGFERPKSIPTFSHLAQLELHAASPSGERRNSIHLIGSYHPSRQNTYTKRLTEPMFDSAFQLVNHLCRDS